MIEDLIKSVNIVEQQGRAFIGRKPAGKADGQRS